MRRGVGNKILLLFTVKQKKQKILTEWSCTMRLPWNIGSKVKFQNPFSEDAYELKRKYEPFLFDFFIACNFMQFHFLLLLHGSVYVKGSHRANNGKPRTRLAGDLFFTKTSLHKCQVRVWSLLSQWSGWKAQNKGKKGEQSLRICLRTFLLFNLKL